MIVNDQIVNANAYNERGGENVLESVTFTANVRQILNNSFMMCKKLRTITFEEGLEVIGTAAFFGCESIEEIRFPKSLKTIGADAFRLCKVLAKVEISDELLLTIPDGVFAQCLCEESLNARRNVLIERRDERLERERVAGFSHFFSELYNYLRHDRHFIAYKNNYQTECENYAQVQDWTQNCDRMLERIYLTQNNFIANVDRGIEAHFTTYNNNNNLQNGDMGFLSWETLDRNELACICNTIRNVCNDKAEEEILRCWNRYRKVVRLNLKVVFNRMIAALRPDMVVPVPVIAGMNEFYQWLVNNRFLIDDHFNFTENLNSSQEVSRWFMQSRKVHRFGEYCLPDIGRYEWGPLVWFLVELFSDNRIENPRIADLRQKICEARYRVPRNWENNN